jgi:flagellar motor protein MotB
MRIKTLVSTAALSLLLGSTALVCAQDEHNDAKPPQEPRPEATRPAQDEARPPQQDEAKPPKQQDEAKPPKQDEVKPPKHEDAKPPKQGERAEPQGHDEKRATGQPGGRIPDDKFRAHFGREHKFVVNRVTVVEGQPRFQYSGYWFTIVDPWPVGWAYTDDCYIDYIDGEYFLFDLLHPGVRIAVIVVM